MPSFPLNQGAFTACAKVSQLEAFTQTAEVKVDPDKPLEGARLAVLQVALWERNTNSSYVTEIHLYSVLSQCSFDLHVWG